MHIETVAAEKIRCVKSGKNLENNYSIVDYVFGLDRQYQYRF